MTGSTNNNEVIIENSTVNGNVGGGYNQAGGNLSASDNTVVVKILPTASEESFRAGSFIAGGIIGDKQKGPASQIIIQLTLSTLALKILLR